MITFLVVDDHPLVRRATKELILDNFKDSNVLDIDSAEKSIDIVSKNNIDLVIMDIYFKNQAIDGIDAIFQIMEVKQNTKVIIISNEDNVTYIRRLQNKLPRLMSNFGYILKNEPEDIIVEAIKTILEGESYYSIPIFRKLINIENIDKVELPSIIQKLTDGELGVIKKVAQGKTNEKIAKDLNISRRTVDARLSSIYTKLLVGEIREGVIPRVEAILKAKKYSIITDDDIKLVEE